MFEKTKAFSGFSVDEVRKAKEFYNGTLGLQVTDGEMNTLTLHIADGGVIMIYPKGTDHTPASFTVLNFPVNDIDIAVNELTKKGVTFEKYDNSNMKTDEKGVYRGASQDQGPNIAWFKDPAGNILSVIEVK